MIMVEERTKILDESIKRLSAKVDAGLSNHEGRLIRLETLVEVARPDGTILRIAPEPG